MKPFSSQEGFSWIHAVPNDIAHNQLGDLVNSIIILHHNAECNKPNLEYNPVGVSTLVTWLFRMQCNKIFMQS